MAHRIEEGNLTPNRQGDEEGLTLLPLAAFIASTMCALGPRDNNAGMDAMCERWDHTSVRSLHVWNMDPSYISKDKRENKPPN